MKVFCNYFKILRENRKVITDRILLCFDINPAEEMLPHAITLETLTAFYRILIHRDAAISETSKFIEKVSFLFS